MSQLNWEGWSKLRLDPLASDFLKDRLGVGKEALREGLLLRRALSQLPLHEGTIWTWGPEGLRIELDDLEVGLPNGITQEGQRLALALFAKTYLEIAERVVIIEDHDASTTDPLVNRPDVQGLWIGHGEFVYWYATSPNRVDQVLAASLQLNNCLAFTRDTHDLANENRTQLAESEIIEIARDTKHVVVDAFDFEGFIVWSRAISIEN